MWERSAQFYKGHEILQGLANCKGFSIGHVTVIVATRVQELELLDS